MQWSKTQTISNVLQPPLLQERGFTARLERGAQLESSEQKMKRTGVVRNFCPTLTSASHRELCFLSSGIWKHLFLPGYILGNGIFWCSQQSNQWITVYYSAHNRDFSLTRTWLALMSQSFHSVWICGIHSWEATYWSVICDLNYLVILHVEGISNTFSVAQNIIFNGYSM